MRLICLAQWRSFCQRHRFDGAWLGAMQSSEGAIDIYAADGDHPTGNPFKRLRDRPSATFGVEDHIQHDVRRETLKLVGELLKTFAIPAAERWVMEMFNLRR